jgi:hypothetical protein
MIDTPRVIVATGPIMGIGKMQRWAMDNDAMIPCAAARFPGECHRIHRTAADMPDMRGRIAKRFAL